MDAPSCGDQGADEFPQRCPSSNGPCINVAKCGATKSFAESRQRLMCASCFVETVLHQFKKGIQLVKPTKRSSVTPLVVAFSGGTGSSALLSLFRRLQDQDKRKVHFQCHVVWVDCLDVLPVDNAAVIRSRIPELAAGFASFKRIPLCAAFSRGSLEPDEEGMTMVRLKKVFSGSKPLVSWKESLIEILTRSLLVRYAQSVGAHRIVTGESMTRVSVNLFGSLSRGVGSNASSLVSGVDSVTFGPLNILWVRPLVSLTLKELGLYLRAKKNDSNLNLEPILIPTFSTLARDKKHSLDLLSETFLLTLQDAHDHTLPTLVRAANKIADSPDSFHCKEWAHCMGCDPELKKKISNRNSVDSLAKVDRCQMCMMVAPVTLENDSDTCCEAGCGCGDDKSQPPKLCQKCTLLTTEMAAENGSNTADVIVSYRDEVRAKIAEYLLSDDDE